MSKACKAQKMVLLKRADDIMSWEGEQQRDFIKVFGLKGEDIIKIRKVGEDTGKRMQARLFIMDGIRRIMTIANGLTLESYKDYTNCNEFAAFISPHLDPPYIVNIGAHFEYRHGIKQSVTGRDSHVSTLCHEMSHIFWYWGDNQKVVCGLRIIRVLISSQQVIRMKLAMRNMFQWLMIWLHCVKISYLRMHIMLKDIFI